MTVGSAVEVISSGNTREEMERKLHEYFDAGVRSVWYVYPKPREIRVYSAAETFRTFHHEEQVDGGEVLAGFRLSLADLFARPASNT
jgi:Uma2 family endonuclease